MSTEYNSKLIASLYNAKTAKEAENVLDEMEDIADPIFIDPIYENFKRFRTTSISHYFLSALDRFGSKRLIEIGLLILGDPEVKLANKNWLLPLFQKFEYSDEATISLALFVLSDLADKGPLSTFGFPWELQRAVDHLRGTEHFRGCENEIKKIVLNDKNDKDLRRYALRTFLKMNSTLNIQFFMESFKSIDEGLKIILSREISTWKGPHSEKLKQVILLGGCDRASEIIKKSQVAAEKIVADIKNNELKEYFNSGLVYEITNLRKKLNFITEAAESIGFKILPQNESISSLSKAADSEASLIDVSINLRSIVQDFADNLKSHGLDITEIKKLLPDVKESDRNLSLNRLYLFLKAKGVKIDPSVFGLRKLNRKTSLLAHPENKKELIEILKKEGLFEKYTAGEWSLLHEALLREYKVCLEELLDSLTEFSKTDLKLLSLKATK